VFIFDGPILSIAFARGDLTQRSRSRLRANCLRSKVQIYFPSSFWEPDAYHRFNTSRYHQLDGGPIVRVRIGGDAGGFRSRAAGYLGRTGKGCGCTGNIGRFDKKRQCKSMHISFDNLILIPCTVGNGVKPNRPSAVHLRSDQGRSVG